MTKIARRLPLSLMLAFAVLALVLASASAADASSTVVQVSTSSGLPDPGISDFGGSEIYVYGTGSLFPFASASTWNGTYSGLGQNTAMQTQPPWVGPTCSTSNGPEPEDWAPQVVEINGTYVMYFSACETDALQQSQGRTGSHHCIGIATSSSPTGPFTAPTGWTDNPYCAPTAAGAGAEAIDPAPFKYQGSWYMAYKTSLNGNQPPYEIWVDPLGTTGLDARADGNVSKLVFTSTSSVAEGPDIVEHGGDMWLFLSRGAYNTCNYEEEAWEASDATGSAFYNLVNSPDQVQDPTLFSSPNPGDSPYTMLTSVNVNGQSLCGAAGASVTPDGDYMAFAAHTSTNPDGSPAGDRYAFVSPLYWDGGPVGSDSPTIVTP